jgi:hypothetical protein
MSAYGLIIVKPLLYIYREIENSKRVANINKKIESADKMTVRQIAVKVRSFFKPYL